MIMVTNRDGALLLPVRIQPGASRSSIGGEHDGRLKISVTAAPEKGKANKAVIKQLAKLLGVSRSKLGVAAGETHRNKLIEINGVDFDTLSSSLSAADNEIELTRGELE